MTRMPTLLPDDLDADQRALYDDITTGPRASGPRLIPFSRADGSLIGPLGTYLLSPPVGRAMAALGAALRFETSLPPRLRELAILTVANRRDSQFEWFAHEAVGRSVGLTDAELDGIRRGDPPAYSDDREQVGALLIEAMLGGDVDDDLWRQGEETLGTRALFELSTIVGHYSMLALQMRVFRTDESVPD